MGYEGEPPHFTRLETVVAKEFTAGIQNGQWSEGKSMVKSHWTASRISKLKSLTTKLSNDL
jgi:hypothetical protein